MDSGIEFGEVQHQKPDQSLRPDQDPHFAVFAVGEISASDMPIYVDMDTMRDMEGHARSNTSVELGGVMLGYQFHDADEKPFVLVTDCLRAEHYEATKGSFKFTHDTWQVISRQRDEYPEKVQMVGWYHTHPDWGVFLSGMDLFICNNFFSRPLDVALVIDPCRDDRGWFQWKPDEPKQTDRTGGFYLYASRFRQAELEYFANLYSGNVIMASDPRYNPAAVPGGTSVVNINDQRTPIQNIAIMGMLTIQMLVLALLAYKLLSPDEEDTKNLAKLESNVAKLADDKQYAVRETAYLDALDKMAASDGNSKNLVTELVDAKSTIESMEIQEAASTTYAADLRRKNKSLDNKSRKLNDKLIKTEQSRDDYQQKFKDAKKENPGGIETWMLIVGGLFLALFGGIGGYMANQLANGRARFEDEEIDLPPKQIDSLSLIENEAAGESQPSDDINVVDGTDNQEESNG
jgi:proteasome lid subunit RPN8/RPN11